MRSEKIQQGCQALDVVDFIGAHLDALSRLDDKEVKTLTSTSRMETASRLLRESEAILFEIVTDEKLYQTEDSSPGTRAERESKYAEYDMIMKAYSAVSPLIRNHPESLIEFAKTFATKSAEEEQAESRIADTM